MFILEILKTYKKVQTVVANNIATLIFHLGFVTIREISRTDEVRNAVSFLPGEAPGCIARRIVSHLKCPRIMCNQQGLSVEGQQLSSPAEKHGLFQRDQSGRPALARLLAIQ